MNRLTSADRAFIIQLLCEGGSISAIACRTGASKNTIAKLLGDAGKACMAFHDANVVNFAAKRIQVDEIWSFTYAKRRGGATLKAAPYDIGDIWTWTAIEADTKLMVSYFVGGRDSECALLFMDDLRSRLANRVQLTSDGRKANLEAVEGAFGDDVDYSMLVKLYGGTLESAKGHCSVAECTSTRNIKITGHSDRAHVSMSYAERNNPTMHMRRFTSLSNAFSKKVENHAYAVALHMVYYNFVRIHRKLRVTPAMAAGVASHLREVSDIVTLVEAAEAQSATKTRGAHKERG